MKERALLLPIIALATIAARAPILVPDVSQRSVEIAYSFTGAELLLFGAIIYPDGKVPDERADIAVVLKGPSRSILVREKQKLLGLIWINAQEERYQSAPDFYAVATSRPIDQVVDERTAAIYELGLGNIQLSPAGSASRADGQRFEGGLIDLRERTQLFASRPNAVEITQDVLYRARLSIPARVPVGTYTAETFLISRGRVMAAATRTISIKKSGFERFVANSAEQSPFLYGGVAILLSLLLGWAAGEAFRRG